MSYGQEDRFHFREDQNSPGFSRGQTRGRGRGGARARGRGRGRGRGVGKNIRNLGAHIDPIPVDRAQLNTHLYSSPRPGPSRGSLLELNSCAHPNKHRGSSLSTRRAIPPRKHFLHASQDPTPKGGLGFHSNASYKSASRFLPPPSKPTQSFHREKTDPRLWVPVKFVKATALTDKSLLENIQTEELEVTPVITSKVSIQHASTPIEPVVKEESLVSNASPILENIQYSTLEPDSEPLERSTKDDQTQMKNFSEVSIEHWQAQFPGIFYSSSSINAFPNRTTKPQSSTSSDPPKKLSRSKDGSLIYSKELLLESASNPIPQPTSTLHSGSSNIQPEDSLSNFASLGIGSSDKREKNPNADFPLSSEMSSSPYHSLHATQISQSDIELSKLISSPDAAPTVPKSDSPPAALFFVDDEGDPQLTPSSFSSYKTAIGQVLSKDANNQGEEIASKPSHVSPSNSQLNHLHLFRTITDEANLESHIPCNQSFNADPQPRRPTIKACKKSHVSKKSKQRRKLARQNRFHNHRPDTDSGSDIDLGDEIEQATTVGPTLAKTESSAASRKAKKRALKEKEENELLEDYIKHTMMSEEEGSDDLAPEMTNDDRRLVEKMKNDIFLKTFLHGMDPQESHHITIDQLDQHSQDMKDDEFLADGGWQSDSSDDSLQNGLEGLGLEASNANQDILECESSQDQHDTDQISSELLEMSSDDESEIDLNLLLTKHKSSPKSGKGKRVTSKAKFEAKWPEKMGKGLSMDIKIEDLLESLEMRIASDSDLSDSESQSDDFEEEDEDELPTLTKDIFVHKKNRKSKRNKSGYSDEDEDLELIEFIDQLQAQWKKDRSRKAERKKERAEARLLNDPYTKKQRKKLKKRDMKNRNNQEPDLIVLDKIIRDFITFRPDQVSLSLPPLSKKIRARVHQLATLYSMTSRSSGSGNNRHPVLHRTHRTQINSIDKQKHRRIIDGREQFYNENQLHQFKVKEGKSSQGKNCNTSKKTREGEIVGGGVAHIGEENVGFKLLTKMGWSLGQTIGHPNNSASALQVPLLAVMKSTKAGLGLSNPLQSL